MSDDEGFKVSKELSLKGHYIYTFIFQKGFTDQQFMEYLALLTKLLELKTPFLMLIDTTLVKHIPLKASILLINWMKKRRSDIVDCLIGSSVVVKSSMVANIINAAFKIQKPSAPNKITTSYDECLKFLNNLEVKV